MFSVVILTHKWPSLLPACLESLSASKGDLIFEIIVINDGGPDIIESIVNTYSNNLPIKYIKNKVNKGISYSRNIGIINSRGLYITFFADNYTISKNHFTYVVQNFDSYDIVSSNVITIGNGFVSSVLNNYYQNIVLGWTHTAEKVKNGYSGKKFPSGAASSYKKNAIEQTGFFDTSLKTGEDTDFNLSLDTNNKKRIYVPDIIVYRAESIGLYQVVKKHYNYGKNYYYLSKKKGKNFSFYEEYSFFFLIVKNYLKAKNKIIYFPFFMLISITFRIGIIMGYFNNKSKQ